MWIVVVHVSLVNIISPTAMVVQTVAVVVEFGSSVSRRISSVDGGDTYLLLITVLAVVISVTTEVIVLAVVVAVV